MTASARQLGLGRTLLKAALAKLSEAGVTSAALAVVQKNTVARQFYKACGGQEAGSFIDAGLLWKPRNTIIVWHNLDKLAV